MSIESRLDRICYLLGIPNDKEVIHALACAYKCGLTRVFSVKVIATYYEHDLEGRAALIGETCYSTDQLCKCLLYENCAAPEESREFAYSRYYCLIYYYKRKFSASKFAVAFRGIAKAAHPELTKSSFKWKFVKPDVAMQLTGSKFNGMSFLGFTEHIPIVFDSAINYECCFIGGLDPFTKVRVEIQEVCAKMGAQRLLFTDECANTEISEGAEDTTISPL